MNDDDKPLTVDLKITINPDDRVYIADAETGEPIFEGEPAMPSFQVVYVSAEESECQATIREYEQRQHFNAIGRPDLAVLTQVHGAARHDRYLKRCETEDLQSARPEDAKLKEQWAAKYKDRDDA